MLGDEPDTARLAQDSNTQEACAESLKRLTDQYITTSDVCLHLQAVHGASQYDARAAANRLHFATTTPRCEHGLRDAD